MQNEQHVIRLEAGQQQLHLSMMREQLKEYHSMIQRLKECYDEPQWGAPLSSYVNFRDALCHYAVACHCEELIALRQESNAMEEHLHRAVKDMVVNYLQILGERILEVYSYIPTTEDAQQLELKDDVNFYEHVEDLIKRKEYKTFVQSLRQYYEKDCDKRRKALQKWLHEVRNFDLIRRDASLRIEKPFSKEGLKAFYTLIGDCKKDLEDKGLYQLVFLYGDFFDPEATEFFLQE